MEIETQIQTDMCMYVCIEWQTKENALLGADKRQLSGKDNTRIIY